MNLPMSFADVMIAMKIDSSFAAVAAPHRAGLAAKPALPFFLPAFTPVGTPPSVSSVRRAEAPGLIAAVAAEQERQQRRQRRQSYAAGLLDRLDQMALGLATGTLESTAIEALGLAMRQVEGASDDPALESLVEAIELRAAVEMAKIAARSARFREVGEG